jgi:predicted small lipoprotein YifL
MKSRYPLTLLLALLFAAGCGQKGPLYLPGDPSEIKTDVPPPEQNEAEEDDEDDEEEESQYNN